jgi:hypothetical protein
MRRHTPFGWLAVLRQQNCQVHAKGVHTRYCFSKKVGIGIGVCIRPPSFVCRQAPPPCVKEFDSNIEISYIQLKIFNWGLDKILLLC